MIYVSCVYKSDVNYGSFIPVYFWCDDYFISISVNKI